jgi:hypothetical protein
LSNNPETSSEQALIAAVDIGSLNNSIAFMDTKGHILNELKKLNNNLPGINKLWEDATRLIKEYNLDTINFVMESSGSYWWLKDKCSTLKSSFVTALTPDLIRGSGFKGKFSHKKQKTDPKDAKTIANRFRFGQFDPVYVSEGNLLSLRFYTRYRLHIVHTLAAAKTFFLSYLFLKISEYGRYCKKKRGEEDKLFSNVFGATSSMIITKYPAAEELAKAPIYEPSSLIEATSKGMVIDAKGRAEPLPEGWQGILIHCQRMLKGM